MLHEEKQAVAETIMCMLENNDALTGFVNELRETELSDITPEMWVGAQDALEAVVMTLGVMRQYIQAGAQVLENDALLSHATAVIQID